MFIVLLAQKDNLNIEILFPEAHSSQMLRDAVPVL